MSSAETGRTVAVCHALSHLEGVHLACGIHLPRGGEVWERCQPKWWCHTAGCPGICEPYTTSSATEVLRCGSVCPRSKPARGMRMPPGIACCPVGVGSGRRCWATVAIATVGTAAGACEGAACRSGAGACYGAGACGAAPPHAAMNSATSAIPNSQKETLANFIV